MLVVDASAFVVALVDNGDVGRWCRDTIGGQRLATLRLMPFEVANAFRGLVIHGALSTDMAAIALAELRQLTVEWFDYELVGRRAWTLRDNLTTYDACYVALAQLLGAQLVTCDRKLARSSAVAQVPILTPPG